MEKVKTLKFSKISMKIFKSEKLYFFLRWWTRSWKTFSILYLFAFWLLFWKIQDKWKIYEKWVASIVRRYWANHNTTTIRDFLEILEIFWLKKIVKYNKNDKTFTFWQRIVEFIWADDFEKVKWAQRQLLYVNEAWEIKYDVFLQLSSRNEDYIFIDFNPDDVDCWMNKEIEEKGWIIEKWDTEFIVSTYLDNKHIWENQKRMIERMKNNESWWNVYWLWNYWKIEGLIFKDNVVFDEEFSENMELLWYGLDFWFSNDESALVWVYKWKNWIFLKEFLYKKWVLPKEYQYYLNQAKVWNKKVIADSARPEIIAELQNMWFQIEWAKKWSWSVKYWIDKMKEFTLYIDKESWNLKKEFKKYCRLQLRNWDYTNEPIDEFNHWIDAIRYFITYYFWNKTSYFWKILK